MSTAQEVTSADISASALTDLEQSRSLLKCVFAAMPCGVAIVDRDYRVLDANAAYSKPLGLNESEVRGRRCHEAFGSHSSPCAEFGESCPIASARTTGSTSRIFREHRLPDGRNRNLEYIASPLLSSDGSISAFVVAVNDLSSLRAVEQRLVQAETALEDLRTALSRHREERAEDGRTLEQARMEVARLGRARSEFIAAVSQELRTPLAALSEGVGLVEDGSFGALNAEQQTFLRLAGKNTKRLTGLLNDLLDLSRIEAGHMKVHRRKLDLCRVAREAATTFDSIARSNRQTLKVDLPAGLEPALADEQSVLRILNSLVGNAVKFTPAGGCITIAVDRLSIGNRRSEPGERNQGVPPDARPLTPDRAAAIAVSVSDTSAETPIEPQSELSGSSERAVPHDIARQRGAGLELALSRQLAELNGGRLWLESEEGRGARFSFTLPVHTEFAGLAADLQYFTSTAADSRNGTPTVYCFCVQPGRTSVEVLPRLEELLDLLVPKPVTLSVISSACAVLAFAPRKLLTPELEFIAGSLSGASLFAGRQKSETRLRFGSLDYDLFRLRLQTLTAEHPEPTAGEAEQWWNDLFEEMKPGLAEVP
jgi:PAS domain S-box-containing protein